MARQDRVSIMLETVIKERFHYYAESMGLTDSALGAFLLGQWVFQQDRVNGPVLEAIKAQMTEVLGKEMQGMKDLIAGGEFGEMQADQEENQTSGVMLVGDGSPSPLGRTPTQEYTPSDVCDKHGVPLKPGQSEYEQLLMKGIKNL